VAALCQFKYEINEHSPYAWRAGVSEAVILSALNDSKYGLNELQVATVELAEALTQDVKVPGRIFNKLRQWLNDRQMVEIITTVSALNCAARFSAALDVGEFD